MSERQVTIGLPKCEPDHPPRGEWPTANLTRGICPRCGWHESDGQKSARVLRARQIVKALGQSPDAA